jgi:hypothetical protein
MGRVVLLDFLVSLTYKMLSNSIFFLQFYVPSHVQKITPISIPQRSDVRAVKILIDGAKLIARTENLMSRRPCVQPLFFG